MDSIVVKSILSIQTRTTEYKTIKVLKRSRYNNRNKWWTDMQSKKMQIVFVFCWQFMLFKQKDWCYWQENIKNELQMPQKMGTGFSICANMARPQQWEDASCCGKSSLCISKCIAKALLCNRTRMYTIFAQQSLYWDHLSKIQTMEISLARVA